MFQYCLSCPRKIQRIVQQASRKFCKRKVTKSSSSGLVEKWENSLFFLLKEETDTKILAAHSAKLNEESICFPYSFLKAHGDPASKVLN